MSNAGGLGSDTTVKVVGVSYFKLVVVFVLGFLTRGYLVVFDHEFQDYSVRGIRQLVITAKQCYVEGKMPVCSCSQ